MISIYQSMLAHGVQLANHQSDLYVESTELSRSILASFQEKGKHKGTEFFSNQIDGRIWIDIPFAYDPYWEQRTTVKKG